MAIPDGIQDTEIKITTDEEWHDYYAALGRLMFAFATMEEEFSRFLETYIVTDLLHLTKARGRQREVVRALISGQRVSNAKDTLKRLLRVSEASDDTVAEVSKILAHLSDLMTFRDQLAHHTSYPTMHVDGSFQTTNQSSARELMKIEWVSFHPSILFAAANDLDRLVDRLRFVLNPSEKDRLLKVSDDWHAHIHRTFQPWQYKPAELIRKGPKHDNNPQWRRLPPES